MKLVILSRNWTVACFTLGFLCTGLVPVRAQQQGRGGRQIDAAQALERLQQLGFDPAQMIQRAQQSGIDTSQFLDRMRQSGVDTTQLENLSAQPAGGAALRGGGFGQGGGRNALDPAQLADRMVDTYQEQLEFADDEWAVVRPLVKDVVEKKSAFQADSNPLSVLASFGGGRLGGGAGAGRTTRGNTEANPEETALREAVDATAAAPDIKAKLEAYRALKKKQSEELKTAREKLRKVLSVRREAKAVLAGLLE